MSAATLGATISRAIADCEPFGSYWGPGPIAASHWVATEGGEFAIVKASHKDRPARLLDGMYQHSHDGGRLCSCSQGISATMALAS